MDPVEADALILSTITGPEFCRAVFSGVPRGEHPTPWQRIVVRPIIIQGESALQFSYFDAKKDISKNANGDEAVARVKELLALRYSGIHLTTTREEIDLRITKKGKILIGRKTAINQKPTLSHNRVKDLPFPEDQPNRLLELLGIQTATGQIRPTMRGKFTQINEFLKNLVHLLPDSSLLDLKRPITYLTAVAARVT